MSNLVRVIAHWTAGRYSVSSVDRDHYHFIYDGDGNEVAGRHTPEDNISATDRIYGAHTRRLNTGSIGVAVACMHGARENVTNGSQPMTEEQFDAMCRGIARLCERYRIPVTRRTVLSHAEVQGTLGVAQRGKWDFTVLPFAPELRGARACGDFMRARVQRYMNGQIEDPARGRNDRVAWLQRLLREEGYDILADGWEGQETEEAVRQFERFNGLPETGSLGTRATVNRLRENAEARRPDRNVIEHVAAEGRVSKTEVVGGALTGGGALVAAGRDLEVVQDVSNTVSEITGLEIATVAALIVVAAGAWFFWDRWRKKQAARKALDNMGPGT